MPNLATILNKYQLELITLSYNKLTEAEILPVGIVLDEFEFHITPEDGWPQLPTAEGEYYVKYLRIEDRFGNIFEGQFQEDFLEFIKINV